MRLAYNAQPIGRAQARSDMFLDEFHSVVDGDVRISAEQGSRFAKQIAGDFNPIHDAGAKRFCVPGDLLFALVLAHYGLSERMHFSFQGMLGADVPLRFPEAPGDEFVIADRSGKPYLEVERAGARTSDQALIEAMTCRYVAFSGRNFPDILQPLMAAENVMFNPDRPLVIYDSMGFELRHLDFCDPEMTLAESNLAVEGKRGAARLRFDIGCGGGPIGAGSKKLVLSGLREYDDMRMQAVIAEFHRRRAAGGAR